eukprot:Em0009g1223a
MKRQKRKDSSKTRRKAKVPKLSESEKPDSAYNSSIDSEDEAEVEKPSGTEDVASPEKDDAAIAAATTGAGKTKIVGLYKPPTHEELQTLKETENLFQSNLMRLQITELLAEVKPKKSAVLDEFLHQLRDVLMTLPSSEPVDLCEALTQVPKTVAYPLRLSLDKAKGKFKFLPPSTIKIAGSYLLQTLVKPDLNVDVVMVMPEGCLQAKDHLNYRYFHKRALYLCRVAGHLKKKKSSLGLSAVSFATSGGDPLRPVLVLKLKGKGVAKYTVKLHTSMPEHYFKTSRLTPDKANIRRGFLTGTASEADGNDGEDVHLATPHYNTTLLCEMGSMDRHLHTIYSAIEGFPGMADAIALCKVWARQRGLDKGYGGFSGFHFAMLLCVLLELKKINKLMSSYQIVRVLFQYLTDWPGSGIAMETSDPTAPSLDVFSSCFDVVFIDSSGFLNLCASMSSDQLEFLKHEAAQSLRCLDNQTVNGFEAFFMKKVPFVQQFDAFCHIEASALATVYVVDDQLVQLDATLWPLPYALRSVMPVIKRGLGKRVTLVTTKLFPDREWPVSEESPDFLSGHVTVGLLLDAEHAYSLLDMGPAADSSEASEFRTFWGDKSELRRFQDASINEAVVWNGRSFAERRTICHQVIQHLLKRHAHIEPSAVAYSITILDRLLSHPSYKGFIGPSLESSDMMCECTGEEVTKEVLTTFEKLSKELRQLSDLPLAITSLQPISAVFRHAEAFPPLPWNGKMTSGLRATQDENCQDKCFYPCDTALPPYVPALEVICQLEASGKWPDELDAIGKIKTAFYIKMHKLLGQSSVLSSPTVDYIDILMDGYVFRVRIHYPPRAGTDEGAVWKAFQWGGRCLATEGDGDGEEGGVPAPAHLHTQWPPSAVLCLWEWCSASLWWPTCLSPPAPYTVPGSALCVLLRFLDLMVHFDWASDPLIVNLNHELKASDLSEVSARFNTNRTHHPSMFISTSYDRFSSCWTRPNPTHPVLIRAQQLAKESLAVLSQQLQEYGCRADVDFLQAFRTPLQDYNVLLHLNRKMVVAPELCVLTIPTVGEIPSLPFKRKHHFSCLPVIDFNVVEKYVKELESFYSEFGLFFYDKYGSNCVAVAWKPHAFICHPFKTSHVHCRTPVDSARSKEKSPAMVAPDVKAITDDFQVLGEGLVKSIDVQCDPPVVSGDTS